MTAGLTLFLGLVVTSILLICVIVFAYKAKPWRVRLIAILLLFPLLTQLWMIVSISKPIGVFIVIAAGLGACALGLITFIMLIRQRFLHSHASASTILTFVISVCVIPAMFAGFALSDYQRTGNNERGSRIGEAIQRYHKDNGHYPKELNELHGKYLDTLVQNNPES